MRVLVTGATGFVGRALVRRLVLTGYDPVVVTRGDVADPRAVRWDFGCEPAPTTLPQQIDAIVHTAQSRNHRAFPADGREMFAVNTASTFALLDYAATAGASRFCLLSSGTVYQPFRNGLDEEAPLRPDTCLGATKLAAEVIATPFSALMPVAVLRIFSPYGPGQTDRIVPSIIGRVRGEVPVELSADGKGLRLAPIYVDDLCDIVIESLARAWNGVFNVASPRAVTLSDLAEIIGMRLAKRPVFEIGNGTALDLVPPVARLGQLFDLTSLVPLEVGLDRTLAEDSQH
ncbi:NAD-dependent epimerase/dehydratase family protein [Methylobacterium sp. J-070]|uniref:NAD-dependent epimerase/dehydratase family protein n=1 Tax=Methylobacterium sp. J-070 TaxID=2836650 RepID=UPI001FB8B7CB|nr:NAD(P)-dependent oxidoreductase [Methylobacterium sp. J-070]MCJ2054935.1 NAD(P)-dependent oxidoreductase [Methylobacterium sp. J-070]